MKEEELATLGRHWLRVVAFAKAENILSEMEHVRFRDSDLSIKGGALLGFAGLMLAADLVFLSAGQGSLIVPDRSCVTVGVGSLAVLVGGWWCVLRAYIDLDFEKRHLSLCVEFVRSDEALSHPAQALARRRWSIYSLGNARVFGLDTECSPFRQLRYALALVKYRRESRPPSPPAAP